MNNKGLCITCVNDKECNFSRKFPIMYCEEFSTDEPEPSKAKGENKQEIESG